MIKFQNLRTNCQILIPFHHPALLSKFVRYFLQQTLFNSQNWDRQTDGIGSKRYYYTNKSSLTKHVIAVLQGLTIKLFLFQLFFLFPKKLRKPPLFLKNNNSAMRWTCMREHSLLSEKILLVLLTNTASKRCFVFLSKCWLCFV